MILSTDHVTLVLITSTDVITIYVSFIALDFIILTVVEYELFADFHGFLLLIVIKPSRLLDPVKEHAVSNVWQQSAKWSMCLLLHIFLDSSILLLRQMFEVSDNAPPPPEND